MKGPPVALLALCALVLFISNWDMNAAIAALSRLLLAPVPSDLTLGNVIGLNPFHEYAAWRILFLRKWLPKAPADWTTIASLPQLRPRFVRSIVGGRSSNPSTGRATSERAPRTHRTIVL